MSSPNSSSSRSSRANEAHHAHAGEVLLHARGQQRELRLHRLEAALDALAEEPHRERDQRQRQQRVEREARTDRQHQEHGGGAHRERVDQIHEAGTEHHAHRGQIVGRARHQLAGAMGLEVLRGQLQETPEEIVAQIELDVARHADHEVAHPVLEGAASDRDDEQDHRVAPSLPAVTPL